MDLELVEHLHHAKRLLSSSSSSTFAQFNLRAGSAATRLQHSPSGGSRRARTPASTSTRPSPLPSRCCHDRSLFHHLDSDVQEVPFEVKEDFVRRAVLLMHAHPMVSKIEDGIFFLTTSHIRRRRRKSAVAPSEVQGVKDISIVVFSDFCDLVNWLSYFAMLIQGFPIVVI